MTNKSANLAKTDTLNLVIHVKNVVLDVQNVPMVLLVLSVRTNG